LTLELQLKINRPPQHHTDRERRLTLELQSRSAGHPSTIRTKLGVVIDGSDRHRINSRIVKASR
jgi:hypothetical protein